MVCYIIVYILYIWVLLHKITTDRNFFLIAFTLNRNWSGSHWIPDAPLFRTTKLNSRKNCKILHRISNLFSLLLKSSFVVLEKKGFGKSVWATCLWLMWMQIEKWMQIVIFCSNTQLLEVLGLIATHTFEQQQQQQQCKRRRERGKFRLSWLSKCIKCESYI